MPRPRSGDWLADEISAWHREGLNVVVSLLESHEAKDLDLTQEEMLCKAAGLEFISFPIADRGVPVSLPKLTKLVCGLVESIGNNRSVAFIAAPE